MFDISLSGLGSFLLWVLAYHVVALGIVSFLYYFYDSEKADFLLIHVKWASDFKDWMWSVITHPARTRERRLFKRYFGFQYDDFQYDNHMKARSISEKLQTLGENSVKEAYSRKSRKMYLKELKEAYKLASKFYHPNVRTQYQAYIPDSPLNLYRR